MKTLFAVLLLASAAWAQITAGSQPTYSPTSGVSWKPQSFYDTRYFVTCDGTTDTTTSMSALLTTISTNSATIAFTSGQCLLSNTSFPANVDLNFSGGGGIKVVTGQTVTILGYIQTVKRQIFFNALASQGTISLTNNTKTTTLYPEWFGAKKDGVVDDTAALQAVTDVAGAATASNPGASTIDLGCGVYKLTSQWTIASSNGQHHVNVVGVNPLCTTINATVGAFPATAIYMSKEKFVSLSGFFLHQAGTVHTGTGITLGGLTGSGTQTNGSTLENITVDSFQTGILTTDSVLLSTSSEMVFNQIVLQNNTSGFVNTSFNGLNYLFNMLQITGNTIGMDMETSGLTVVGGAGSANGTDFKFNAAFGTNSVTGFRSETATTCAVVAGGASVTFSLYNCQGLTTPATHTAITQSSGMLRLENSFIGGQIVESGGGADITIQDSYIIDPNNTYSFSSQPANMGPGFRMSNPICGTPSTDCGHFNVSNTRICNASNVCTTLIPSSVGWYTAGASSLAISTNSTQGPTLAVAANAITVTAYVHHVGAGLIKNINLPTNGVYPNEGTVNWEMNCVQLIADSAYTTDATGNISVALTATTGQVITWCLDPLTAKWYPSTGAGAFTSLTITGPPSISTGTASNTDLAGELSFSAATTSASYTFAGTYTSHPECTFGPLFTPTAGHVIWISTLSTTTLQFSSDIAQTGSVSYICTGRN